MNLDNEKKYAEKRRNEIRRLFLNHNVLVSGDEEEEDGRTESTELYLYQGENVWKKLIYTEGNGRKLEEKMARKLWVCQFVFSWALIASPPKCQVNFLLKCLDQIHIQITHTHTITYMWTEAQSHGQWQRKLWSSKHHQTRHSRFKWTVWCNQNTSYFHITVHDSCQVTQWTQQTLGSSVNWTHTQTHTHFFRLHFHPPSNLL